ncbi:MAG: glycosyltransferase family 39 protein [Candidatus Eisenbacteria sp.]|nr:glycosyltransferase family 39 protein [Candidatus Eisenbacteria bacterium]
MRKPNLPWTMAGYAALTILLTYPLAFRLTRLMLDAGAGEDAYIFVWNIWWLKKALLGLQTSPYITDFIFYPDGVNLALHTFPLPGTLLGMILSFFRPGLEGLFVGYNLVILVSFFLSALGTYLLVHKLTGSRSAAFVSGLVYAFTYYRFCNTVRLHALETAVLPFCAWALVGMVEEKKVWWGVLVGIFAAATLYSSKEYFAFLLAGILLAIIYHSVRNPRRIWTRRMLWPKLAAAGCFIVSALPLLAAMSSHGLGGGARATAHAVVFSADFLDFLVPNPRHPLFGSWSSVIEEGFHGGSGGFGMSVPLVAVILSIWAFVTGDRQKTWPWAGLGIFFFLYCLGPVIRLGGFHTQIPSLYAGLTATVPWIEISRTPMRAVVGVHLVTAILVGYALAPTPGGSSRRRLAAAVAGALLVFETLSLPLKMTPVEVHPYYHQLAATPAEGAVLELPPKDRASLLHQTVHERKIAAVRRVYPRSPDRSLTFWRSDGFGDFLDTLFRPERTDGLTDASRALLASKHRRMLMGYGFRFVTVDKLEIPPEELQHTLSVLREMAPERVFEDENLAAFEF